MSTVGEIPPAKTNQKQNQAPQRKQRNPPRPVRPKLTNQRKTGPASGRSQVRVKGQCHIRELYEDEPISVHIDALYLENPSHQVPLLAANFRLYEKYFVHNMSLEFVPIQPVTVGGSISIAPDYDPLDPMPATAAALSQSQGFKSGPVSGALKVDMPNYKGPDGSYVRPELYCAPTNDDRLTSYGQFKVFGEAPSLTKGDNIGKIILHYDVTFHILEPQNPVSSLAINTDRITCVGTANHFTPTDIGSSTISDGLSFGNSGGTLSMDSDYILTGIIKEIGAGLELATLAGRVINVGTRLFFRPLLGNIATTTYTSVDASHYVGKMSTSRDFSPMSNVTMNLINSIAIILSDMNLLA